MHNRCGSIWLLAAVLLLLALLLPQALLPTVDAGKLAMGSPTTVPYVICNHMYLVRSQRTRVLLPQLGG